MNRLKFNILIVLAMLLLTGCINPGGNSAKADDLTVMSGISNHKLLLDGTEGVSSTFSFKRRN